MFSAGRWICFLGLPIYVIGVLIVARIAFHKVDTEEDRETRAFGSVVFGLFWPFIAAITILISPLLGIGWLISRPTGAERRARQLAEREARTAEIRRLEQQYDLPGHIEQENP